MKKIIIIITMCMFCLMCSNALSRQRSRTDIEGLFSQANASYSSGAYDTALRKYMAIMNTGAGGGNLYYNMGNVYMKKREIGQAILNYTRALRYMPADSDTLANISLARSLMKQQEPVEERNILFRWLDEKTENLTISQIAFLMSFLYFLLMAYAIITRVFGKWKRYSAFVISFISLALFLQVFPLAYRIKNLKESAITLIPIQDAKYEPESKAAPTFTLYEGMKVYIVRSQGDWHKVKRTDGKIGWVPRNSVELVGM